MARRATNHSQGRSPLAACRTDPARLRKTRIRPKFPASCRHSCRACPTGGHAIWPRSHERGYQAIPCYRQSPIFVRKNPMIAKDQSGTRKEDHRHKRSELHWKCAPALHSGEPEIDPMVEKSLLPRGSLERCRAPLAGDLSQFLEGVFSTVSDPSLFSTVSSPLTPFRRDARMF